jgi:hypothetical protein
MPLPTTVMHGAVNKDMYVLEYPLFLHDLRHARDGHTVAKDENQNKEAMSAFLKKQYHSSGKLGKRLFPMRIVEFN